MSNNFTNNSPQMPMGPRSHRSRLTSPQVQMTSRPNRNLTELDTRQAGKPKEIVLVLVDGDRYVFRPEFLLLKAQGGHQAAGYLRQALEPHLQRLGLKETDYQVVIRVYANLKDLSLRLSFASQNNGLGRDARSMGAFVAGFNNSIPGCEFIDSGEAADATFKSITNAFDLFVSQIGCRHVFFAACHDEKYASLLTRYNGKGKLMTLVRGPELRHQFQRMSLRIIDLPVVFAPDGGSSTSGRRPDAVMNVVKHTAPAGVATSEIPCRYHQIGPCPLGTYCKYFHDNKIKHDDRAGTDLQPRLSTHPIPVNKTQQRIDLALPALTEQDRAAFAQRHSTRRLCFRIHRFGACEVANCAYDHEPISRGVHLAMQHLLRFSQCLTGGSCRWRECPFSHGCYRSTCRGCRFGTGEHVMDSDVYDWAAHDEIDTPQTGASSSSPSVRPATEVPERHRVVELEATSVNSQAASRRLVLDVSSWEAGEDLIDLSQDL